MSRPVHAREVRLASRPQGWPTERNFELAQAPVIPPATGEILVRNVVMSVDPYMRGRMYEGRSHPPPFQVGRALEGGAVGEVVESCDDRLSPGDFVFHKLGWREYTTVRADQARRVDAATVPPGTHLGVLGLPGLTAHVGLFTIAGFTPGESVFVSTAAGAVGSTVGQLARLHGARRVIGSAGTDAKVRHLVEELGFDAAFNYRDGNVVERLAEAADGPIDVYFDNVGGAQLEAAIGRMAPHGRIAVCGAVLDERLADSAPGPRNHSLLIAKRIRMEGFIAVEHEHRAEQIYSRLASLIRAGRITCPQEVFTGLESAPAAFLHMMNGGNTGKVLVELAPG